MARKKTEETEVNKLTGEVPAKDPEMFKLIFDMICTDYEVNLKTDQFAVNRMASTIMHIRQCEKIIADKGMCLEDANGEMKINPFSYYLNQLNGELRSYMRILKPVHKKEAPAQSFASMLTIAAEQKNSNQRGKKE